MSNTPQLTATISADGKCMHPPVSMDTDEIELLIDGNVLIGGHDSPTLLGSSTHFLSASRQYVLTHFEPREDGCCLVRYRRVR